jgi:hypothetical protein
MDDALVERWKSGDASAATAVRNAVRSWAERVLGHPALLGALGPGSRARVGNEEERREVTARIAAEVMRRDAGGANQVKALALMAAGRLAIEALQEGRPAHPSGGRHVPPPIAVAMVLYPDGVNERVRTAIERHLEECPACREDLRVMDRIVRNLDAVDHQVTRSDLAEEARKADARLAETVDLEQVMREAAQAERERASRATAAPRRPAPGRSKVLPGPDPAPKRSFLRPILPVLGLVVVGIAIWMGSSDAEVKTAARHEGVAALAVTDPPEVGQLSELPSEAQLVVADLGRGNCRQAAGRLPALQSQRPDDLRLLVLEAGCLVCAGDGRRALRVLDELEGRITEGADVARQRHWYRGQALLLEGRATEAVEALRQAEAADPRHRNQARALADRVVMAIEG